MSKKSGGLFTLLVGAAAGAVAVFLSDKKNRQQAKATVGKATKTAKKLEAEFKANPDATVAKLKTQAKTAVKRSLTKADRPKATSKKNTKAAANKSKKTATKKSSATKSKTAKKAA